MNESNVVHLPTPLLKFLSIIQTSLRNPRWNTSAGLFAYAFLLLLSVGFVDVTEAADFIDSSVQESQVTNCITGNQEYGMGAYVGYYGDQPNKKPATGDVYYAHIVLAATGNPCAGQVAFVDLALPPNTALAIDNSNKVLCYKQEVQDIVDCPQILGASQLNPGAFVISAPAASGNPGGFWVMPQGTRWEFRVPLRSSAPLTGVLQANIRAIDGNSSPWLRPSVAVQVFPGVPSIQYPSPSTEFIIPNTPCAPGGQCLSDSDCSQSQVCNCGQAYKSKATINTAGFGGNFYFDLNNDQGTLLFSDPGPLPPNGGSYEVNTDWKPYDRNLVPSKTYHWRIRFPANQQTYVGADQSFVAGRTNSWCGTNVALSKSFELDQRIRFTGTSVTTGDQGVYWDVDNSASSFMLAAKRNVKLCFEAETWHLSSFSKMNMDVRFLLDGREDIALPERFDSIALKLCRDVPSLAAGSHSIKVQVRSVLVSGPPSEMRICGNSHGQNQCSIGQPATNYKAEMKVTILP